MSPINRSHKKQLFTTGAHVFPQKLVYVLSQFFSRWLACPWASWCVYEFSSNHFSFRSPNLCWKPHFPSMSSSGTVARYTFTQMGKPWTFNDQQHVLQFPAKFVSVITDRPMQSISPKSHFFPCALSARRQQQLVRSHWTDFKSFHLSRSNANSP